jgi:hypothetical protein
MEEKEIQCKVECSTNGAEKIGYPYAKQKKKQRDRQKER